ncbi:MAG: 30S ribosomal protein S24e [Candidatus Thermoplasmatota archaeon]|nr:30S ribosomal protein S24e [Candidatus Thermoplasmatota archaeon]MCL6091255.1 30S ribosomal protein S24e [Candidatus Thermoplasmatota archaeon]
MPELKVENERDNKLLHRREIRYRIVFKNEATPSREKIKEIIAKNTGSKKELIIIDRNIQETGKGEVIGYSKIYKDKESALLYEPDYELIRNGLKSKEGEAK